MLKWFVNSGWWLGNRHFSFFILSLFIFSACTDYVSQIEDRYGEWKIDPSTVEKGLMTDSRDGQTYETVKIGTQMWMAQNLNYETANSYCYRDSAKYCSKYGRYYTWAAAKKACPSGWHLPTEADFKTLIGAVGGSSDAEGGIASYVLKSTNGWIDAGVDLSGNGTDDYSFAAFPAGIRYYSNGDYGVGSSAEFWSSTEDDRDSDCAVHLYLGYTDVDNYASGEILYGFYKENGLSVRCIKDEPVEKTSSSNKEKVSSSSKKVESSSSSVVQSVVDPSTVVVGNITDSRDGQSYKTVTIGTQTWMAQNLNYKTANSFCYNDSTKYCEKYGRLYTWAAAMDSVGTWSKNGKGCGYGTTCSPTYPVRGICPEGWHLPTNAEFETLFTAVGGSSNAGTKLKSTSGWNEDNGTDDYSFSALPVGYRPAFSVGYYNRREGDGANFWSSTGSDSSDAYDMYLYYFGGNVELRSYSKDNGFSVRCLKNDESAQSAKSSSSAKVSSSSVAKSSSSQKTVSSSSVKVVDPTDVILGFMTDSRNDQTYKTVKIGTQTWMAENLNYETANSYCYNDTASYCAKYGRLYTWAAAVNRLKENCGYGNSCSLPSGNIQGVCPTGWHLPSQSEWNTLFIAVGGSSTAGAKLKSTSGWTGGGNGSDAFSFSALPAGGMYDDWDYYLEGNNADFWSSTEYNSLNANYVDLNFSDGVANLLNRNKSYGLSVRCLKD